MGLLALLDLFRLHRKAFAGDNGASPDMESSMIRWLQRPWEWFKSFHNSIAYLPTLLATLYIILGVIAVIPRFNDVMSPDWLEALQFHESDTLRTLLATLIAGMISLMVFSFAMVMSILTQAGANFSYKLLHGLVAERHHQWVLGHYLGTILFSLILLTVPETTSTPSFWRSMAVHLGVLMVVHCLTLFIYFIHEASQSVQITAVTRRLTERTHLSLDRLQRRDASPHFTYRVPPSTRKATITLLAQRSGYIQGADFESLRKTAEESDIVVHLDFTLGTYVVTNMPLIRVETREQALTETQSGSICAALKYLEGESVEDHYIHGLTQLMEVAIKALSPGINDPGTARLCLHKLTELLGERLTFTPCNTCIDARGKTRVTWRVETLDSLLYRTLSPILYYGRDDLSICLAILDLLKTLSRLTDSPDVLALLQQHADKVVDQIAKHAHFQIDQTFIASRLGLGDHRLDLPA